MPSPFPGMDPFIELYDWGDFHVSLIVEIKRQLAPQVRPKYFAVAHERVYVEEHEQSRVIVPDIHVTKQPRPGVSPGRSAGTATLEPEIYAVPMPLPPSEHREPFVEIRDESGNRVITVIEILSPTNKGRGTDGHQKYKRKREDVLRSDTNFVEVDLLRGGQRPETEPALRESTDFCALVHRATSRSTAEVFQWTMKHPLPTIPIPLSGADPDVYVDLQSAFTAVWEYSNFADRLDYTRSLTPPVSPTDAAWIQSILNARS